MGIYKNIFNLKKLSNWSFDELMDLSPFEFEIFLGMTVKDLENRKAKR